MIFAVDIGPARFILVVMGVVSAILILFLIGTGVLQKRNQRFEELARKFGGTLEPAGFMSLPIIRFPHSDRTVSLSYLAQGDEGQNYKTSLSISWPDRKLRCEIFPESPVSALRKLIGMQDIQIGSPWFDDTFIITGNDEDAIKALLTPEVQARIGQLYKLKTGPTWVQHVYFHISSGWLTVTKFGFFTSVEQVDPFLELFLDLFDTASLVPSAGIEFINTPAYAASTASSDEAEPHCIVCGEPLAGELVSCRGCKTLHHRDCWQYFGGCATYACGGKQFVPKASGGR
jgi:hypothetical protein